MKSTTINLSSAIKQESVYVPKLQAGSLVNDFGVIEADLSNWLQKLYQGSLSQSIWELLTSPVD